MYWFHWTARIANKCKSVTCFFTHILWIWLLLSVHHDFFGSEGLQGTHMHALNQFSSNVMTLSPRGGLWTISANLALCQIKITRFGGWKLFYSKTIQMRSACIKYTLKRNIYLRHHALPSIYEQVRLRLRREREQDLARK